MKLKTVVAPCLALALAAYLHSSRTWLAPSMLCDMTFMWPVYRSVPAFAIIDKSGATPRYALHLFRQGGGEDMDAWVDPASEWTRESTRRDQARPLLFIHGNAGSYKQARSLGARIAYHRRTHPELVPFDLYTVDLNQELSALHPQLLRQQARYVSACLTFLAAHYNVTTVHVVGHSMGGIVALAAHQLTAVPVIDHLVGMAVPAGTPPVPMVPGMKALYRETERSDLSVLSLIGGAPDIHVPAMLGHRLPKQTDKSGGKWVSVHATAIGGGSAARYGCDHLSIVWCRGVLDRVTAGLANITSHQSIGNFGTSYAQHLGVPVATSPAKTLPVQWNQGTNIYDWWTDTRVATVQLELTTSEMLQLALPFDLDTVGAFQLTTSLQVPPLQSMQDASIEFMTMRQTGDRFYDARLLDGHLNASTAKSEKHISLISLLPTALLWPSIGHMPVPANNPLHLYLKVINRLEVPAPGVTLTLRVTPSALGSLAQLSMMYLAHLVPCTQLLAAARVMVGAAHHQSPRTVVIPAWYHAATATIAVAVPRLWASYAARTAVAAALGLSLADVVVQLLYAGVSAAMWVRDCIPMRHAALVTSSVAAACVFLIGIAAQVPVPLPSLAILILCGWAVDSAASSSPSRRSSTSVLAMMATVALTNLLPLVATRSSK
ncbi:PGAP1-like protein-domain-containing protein [Blastocladiella britannica]|nr:PGAP1-like protein-domain-containing protein [Blastocladiella britannica]